MAADTRTRMLDTTARLLQQRGYHGTSLNDILGESGAPRGSLYFHFPGGKDQLVIEASRAAVDKVTKHRRDVLAAAATPAAAVRAFADGIVVLLRETDYQLGCPIAPIVLDGTSDVADLADLCRSTFEEWIGLLRGSFEEAGIPDKRAEALALLTQSSFEGALLIARAYRDVAPVVTVGGELEAMVAAATPRAA
ncbi:TetR/AcrR family transcriptional regulator [Mesorhizobium sp. ZC-5]|uniref:TetR/AcrR family transcriptional regulator n=1 Tax=Mesorhizobium sp. ZC-5 TaxID=2986066 RepID=UPI0021E983E9|nr:TetR/AcrR family transcriptional regulator [Mesorhizobium sp. ZC-5]MCV3242235.1 TetR/AcrR family transcriptional regulator [Mesorhizobium sp. ZC-5]